MLMQVPMLIMQSLTACAPFRPFKLKVLNDVPIRVLKYKSVVGILVRSDLTLQLACPQALT
jgi:hypothetical protein